MLVLNKRLTSHKNLAKFTLIMNTSIVKWKQKTEHYQASGVIIFFSQSFLKRTKFCAFCTKLTFLVEIFSYFRFPKRGNF